MSDKTETDREYILSFKLPHPSDHHLSVVLARYRGQWVTWMHNDKTGADFEGHYFNPAGGSPSTASAESKMAEVEWLARMDYAERVGKVTYQFPFIVSETVFQFPDLSQT